MLDTKLECTLKFGESDKSKGKDPHLIKPRQQTKKKRYDEAQML